MLMRPSLKWLKWVLKENKKIRSSCQILLVEPVEVVSNYKLETTTKEVEQLFREADAVDYSQEIL
jgi:hypothetical protein